MNSEFKVFGEKMDKTINVFASDLGTIRAGRANPAVLDKIVVDYYGTPTPINQMAAVSVTEARTLTIAPWDASTISKIEKAINVSDIGINPSNDGKIIRLSFPQLTEERRRDLVKNVHKNAEEAKVAIRSIRRDAIEKFKSMKKASEITEDDLKNIEKDVQNQTDMYCNKIDDMGKVKENEIMEI